MRILIALACLLGLAGAASIKKDGVNSESLRESVEANEPSSIVHKTDAHVNAVDNNVYQTDDEDTPAAHNEAINGRNRYGYGRNLISSNEPQPVPKTDTDLSGSCESNGVDSNDFDRIGFSHVYYPVAYGDGFDTRGGVGRGDMEDMAEDIEGDTEDMVDMAGAENVVRLKTTSLLLT
ncbi:Uncharacterized protein APZ42_029477 [Daphnia magna]|uniref:Uncharacterized protein n=1 Tax=Daphnia magna TaxID=35525 RepID=A0A164PLC7_9CRUS|nr:Uncharacterized protein APZ42_029477 [Daphnia magna]